MKIKTWIKYEVGYFSTPRSKKPEYRECEEYVNADLREVTLNDAQIAFEDNSFDGYGGIYYYDSKLWKIVRRNPCIARDHGTKSALEDLMWGNEHCGNYFLLSFDRIHYGKDTSRENVIKTIERDMENRLLINGVLYETTEEPRYIINDFGCYLNYSVGMFVEYDNYHNYGDNCFSALDGEEAVEYANNMAKAGHAYDHGKFKANIKVYMPDLVTVKRRGRLWNRA